ncbi:MAG TPA: hypothetical protein VHL58_03235 [Thermoanaerobaculia bacterium]|nr:hypothetical protein [Thermoanaerobaculia bacterium]
MKWMIALLTMILVAGCATAPTPTEHRGFTGTWALNFEHSESVRDAVKRVFTASGSVDSPGAREQLSDRLENVLRPSELIRVEQMGPKLTFSDGSGMVRVVYTNGQVPKKKLAGAVVYTWNGERLTFDLSSAETGAMKETYELEDAGTQLISTTELVLTRLPQPLVIRRVYDKAM